MLIIDGPDGGGKTTLCEMLLKHKIVDKILPSPKLISGNNIEKFKHETDRYIRNHGNNHRVAVDRLLFSEMAYGPIFRGGSCFSKNEYLNKLLEIMLSGSICIFCLPDKLNHKPTEAPQLLEKMDLVVGKYRDLIQDSAFSNSKTIVYKWDEKDAWKNLISFIKENR